MAHPTGPGFVHLSSQSIGMSRVAPKILAGIGDVQDLRTIGFRRFCTSDRTAEDLDVAPTGVSPPPG
jgi:hypothetical protein